MFIIQLLTVILIKKDNEFFLKNCTNVFLMIEMRDFIRNDISLLMVS